MGRRPPQHKERHLGLALAEADHLILDRLGVDAEAAFLAARHRTVRIATLDRNDFLAVRPLYGDAFELLPAPPT